MELEASPASHIPVSCEATWSLRRGVVEKGWHGEALPAVCHLRTLCEGALGCPHRAVSGLMSVFRQHSAVTGDSRGWLPPPKVCVKHLWQEQLTRPSLAFVSGLIMLSLVSIGPVPEHGPLSSLPQGTAVKQTKRITEWFSTSHRLVAPGLGLWSPKRSLLQLWHAWGSEGMLAPLALPGSPALAPSCPRMLALSPASKTLEFLLFFGVSAPTWDTDPFLYCLQFFSSTIPRSLTSKSFCFSPSQLLNAQAAAGGMTQTLSTQRLNQFVLQCHFKAQDCKVEVLETGLMRPARQRSHC